MSATPIDPPEGSTNCSPEVEIETLREFRIVNRNKSDNFIWGELNNGVLEFIVANQPKDGAGCSGKWMFGKMMQHFAGHVAAIRGSWTYGHNLATVNQLTAGSKMGIEAAAERAWTGKRAAEWGYTKVELLTTTGTPGAYSNVQVLFKTP